MSEKKKFKRKLYLLCAAAPFILRKWSIQKKLYVSLLTLVVLLGLNAIFTTYEVARLKEHNLNLSYLVYLDILGIFSGCLFIWILTQSVIRPMKKMIKQIETKTFIDPHNLYGPDEIGDLARAVSFMKKNHSSTGEVLQEKNRLIEAILNHSIDSIFLFNSHGEILSYSQSFKENFAPVDQEIQEIDLFYIMPHLKLDEVLKKFKGDQTQKKFYIRDLMVRKKNNKMVKIECSICPIKGEIQDIYVGIIRNPHKRNRIKELFTKYTSSSNS